MNLDQELDVLTQMASELPDYVLSEVLFWPMQGRANFPKLTLGLMLLTRARLRAAEDRLQPEARARLRQAEQQIEAALSRWQANAERKAEKELHTRVNLWQQFWLDCADDTRSCADYYAREVTQRAIAELLLREFPRLRTAPEAQALEPLDRMVRARLHGGEFVWPPEIQAGFPETEFWFLYGKPA